MHNYQRRRSRCVLRSIRPSLVCSLHRRKTVWVSYSIHTCFTANPSTSSARQVLFCTLTSEQRDLYRAYISSEEVSSILAGQRNALSGIDILRKVRTCSEFSLHGNQSLGLMEHVGDHLFLQGNIRFSTGSTILRPDAIHDHFTTKTCQPFGEPLRAVIGNSSLRCTYPGTAIDLQPPGPP